MELLGSVDDQADRWASRPAAAKGGRPFARTDPAGHVSSDDDIGEDSPAKPVRSRPLPCISQAAACVHNRARSHACKQPGVCKSRQQEASRLPERPWWPRLARPAARASTLATTALAACSLIPSQPSAAVPTCPACANLVHPLQARHSLLPTLLWVADRDTTSVWPSSAALRPPWPRRNGSMDASLQWPEIISRR